MTATQLPALATSSQPHSRHARKFRRAAIVLAAIGAAAVVATILLLTLGGKRTAAAGTWSPWHPPDNGLAGAQEIADFLSPYYRASSADQLAVVTARSLNNPANPVQIVIPSAGSATGLQALPASSTIAYNLCGVGSADCSIGVGTPSSSRLLLLRREALELALYTFKYISGVQTVVAILPPGHALQGCTGLCPKPHTTTPKAVDLALAFDRKELQPWLNRPLQNTLPEQLPPTVSQMATAPEAELVSVITAHGLFEAHTEHAQDGSNMIVLDPQPPQ